MTSSYFIHIVLGCHKFLECALATAKNVTSNITQSNAMIVQSRENRTPTFPAVYMSHSLLVTFKEVKYLCHVLCDDLMNDDAIHRKKNFSVPEAHYVFCRCKAFTV